MRDAQRSAWQTPMRLARDTIRTPTGPTVGGRPRGLLQRKCACEGTDHPCEECGKKRLALQHRAARQAAPTEVPPIVHEVLRSPGNPLDATRLAFMESRFGHDFSRVRVHTDAKAGELARAANGCPFIGEQDTVFGGGQYILKTPSVRDDFTPLVHENAAVDEESIGDEPESGEPGREFPGSPLPSPIEEIPPMGEELAPGVEPLEGGGEKKAKCPTKTVVDKTIDMTPDGIKKGYRTGYGATAVMRVEPDSTNWDGTQIVESLKQTKTTCPKEFNISPCNGNSTFTVGAEAKSSVLGPLEGKRNRFYDFHITRWNRGSLLHDRNPGNIDSCQVECEQSYSCGGVVIGKHTVTRTFTKGKSGSRDVTLVAVTKS